MEKHTARANRNGKKENIRQYITKIAVYFWEDERPWCRSRLTPPRSLLPVSPEMKSHHAPQVASSISSNPLPGEGALRARPASKN
jgi:hypothetical protein